jgi:hypothetical protein
MVAVKMGGPMPPMGGMPQPMNMMPPPMPVPPMGNPMMPPQSMPMQQGTAPVAPIMRSNAGRRKRFGDSLEGMLATTRPPPVASDQMGGMNVFTGQMPRRQMMGGTAMQPPVRRMMGGGAVPLPRQTDIYGQPHMLAYINPTEASLLEGLGGMGTPGPGGVPQYNFFSDFFSAITGGKSSNTGGRNKPRGSSSSSSQSYTQPSNDPYAEDRGGSSSRATTILDAPSTSTSDANRIAAESMIAGGGGTNLSGSGSTAMERLLADQKAQTQDDSSSSSYTPGSVISGYENQQDSFAQRKADEIRAAKEAQAAAEAEMGLDIFGGAGPDVTPTTNTGVIGGYDTLGIGSSDDPFYTPPPDFTIDDTPPSDITGSFSSPGDLNFLDPSVLYYDIDGVPHNTEAEQQAANRLINERKAREQEEQRIAQVAQLEAEATAEAARAQAERERIAQQAAAEAPMGLGPFGGTGGPDDPLYVSDVFETPEDPSITNQRKVVDALQNFPDELTTTEFNNTGLGLGDPNLGKGKTDATEEEDDRNFIQKFIDDIKDVPKNILNDLQMGIAAGFYGNDYGKARTNLEKVLNADGSRKYSDAQIDAWIAATKDTKKKQMDEQKRLSDQDGDDPKDVVGDVVDPCPTGFKLDPASGICVPVEEDDTDEDSGDDKEEDTSDDELSGVVTTPPPPTSYLDNPIRMNRGGSVGLNRAADNFLAAMGA